MEKTLRMYQAEEQLLAAKKALTSAYEDECVVSPIDSNDELAERTECEYEALLELGYVDPVYVLGEYKRHRCKGMLTKKGVQAGVVIGTVLPPDAKELFDRLLEEA